MIPECSSFVLAPCFKQKACDFIIVFIHFQEFWCFGLLIHSYQSTLKQLFQEFDATDPEDELASVTTRIMMALQNNLDGKSKQYKDPALTQIFLMNNIHYIVRSVRRSVSNLVAPFFSFFKLRRAICLLISALNILTIGQKQRICWEMTGCKYTEGLYSSMLITIRGYLGRR